MKKLFLFLTLFVGFFASSFAQNIDHEYLQSVQVLLDNGIVSSSLQYGLMYAPLARWEGAVLFSQYADLVLGRDPDATAACQFFDVGDSSIIKYDITKSCQMGLLKGSQGLFNPYGSMTRGQLIIVLARMLANDPSLELYSAYDYLLTNKIIKVDDRYDAARVPGRNEVYIMLARFLHTPTSPAIPLKQILLVKTYAKDPLFGNFVLQSEGSAVLLSNTTLLTNAHVVSDELGEPTGLYEVCKVEVVGKDPVCFSSAILERFDGFNDLAVLRLPQAYTQGEVTKFRVSSVRSGDPLTVFGFPYDGGTTITATQGIVAGFESEMIKTDAAVNYGNSGGGAYDKQGQLIGIPSALYGNIGYIIPISTIAGFLSDEDVIFVNTPSIQSMNSSFLSFMQAQHERIVSSKNTLTTSFFHIADLQGFTLSASSEYTRDDISSASYTLMTSDKKTNIFMDVYYIVGDKTIDDQVAELGGYLEDAYDNVSYEEKVYGGTDWHIITADTASYDNDDLLIYYVYVKDGGLFTVRISGSKKQTAIIQKAQILAQSIVVDTIPAASKASTLKLGFVTVPVPSFATIELSVDAESHQVYASYDLQFGSRSYANVSIEECGCSLSDYTKDARIETFLESDLEWYDTASIQGSGTFVTVDGMQGYYIDSEDGNTRSLYAVIKVVDPYHENTVLSVTFYAYGSDITSASIDQLKNYVKTIHIDGKSPFVQ